jgi:hypothetical protein
MKQHPFTVSGLGNAPFECVGVTENKSSGLPDKHGVIIGYAGQSLGSCDHCGTAITYEYHIVSAEGKRSVVGSSCIQKAYKQEVSPELRASFLSVKSSRLSPAELAEKNRQRLVALECRKINNLKALQEVYAHKVAERNRKANSNHIGQVGERVELTGTVRFVTAGEGVYGVWVMTCVDTDNGVVIYWNSLKGAKKGDSVTFFAKIKDHSERDGEKQTIVQRATKIKVGV